MRAFKMRTKNYYVINREDNPWYNILYYPFIIYFLLSCPSFSNRRDTLEAEPCRIHNKGALFDAARLLFSLCCVCM
jgi:hypothetical protein